MKILTTHLILAHGGFGHGGGAGLLVIVGGLVALGFFLTRNSNPTK